MKYAISNWIYADEPLRTTFARLARYGYDGIELVGEPERYSILQIRALSREFQVKVTSVLGWSIHGIPGRDLSGQDNAERAAAVRYGQACIDLASAIEAPILIVLPAAAGRTAPEGNPRTEMEWDSAYKAEWANAVDSVRQVATYAAARHITLAIEPINRYETFLITTLEDALRFLSDVDAPNVQIHLDTFHMNIDEADSAATVRRAGTRLVNVHVADSNREPPGCGHTDFAALMQALHAIHYEGALTLEPVPPGADPGLAIRMSRNLPLRDSYAEESIRYLKQLERATKPLSNASSSD